MKKIACVDLFCGAGGLTHGFVKEGVPVVAGIDLDPACAFPYEANCRIPDDCIDPKRYPLFMARAVLQELIESLQSTQEVKPC